MKKLVIALFFCAAPFMVSKAQVQDQTKKTEKVKSKENPDHKEVYNHHNPVKGDQTKDKKGQTMSKEKAKTTGTPAQEKKAPKSEKAKALKDDKGSKKPRESAKKEK